MRKSLPILMLIAIVILAWVVGIGSMLLQQETSIDSVIAQIEEHEELKTYRKALSLYDQVIAEYPEDITWYERKAHAYYELEAYDAYEDLCASIASQFPDDIWGYKSLLEYYAETNDYENIFSVYAAMPEEFRSDSVVADIYQSVEYTYSYVSSTFVELNPILNSNAVVESNGLFGLVKSTGETLIKCQYEQAHPIYEDNAAVYDGEEWFIIDLDGYRSFATRDKLEDLYSLSEERFLAKVDGKYGYYDANLENPTAFEYEDATVFYGEVAAVKKGGKWALIDSSFNPITDFVFDDVVRDVSNVCSRRGLIFAATDGAYALYNTKGERVGDASFEDAQPFLSDYAAVKQDGKWGLLDKNGELFLACQYDNLRPSDGNLTPACVGDKWGFIDASGEFVIEPEFEDLTALSPDGICGIGIGTTKRYMQFYKYTVEG